MLHTALVLVTLQSGLGQAKGKVFDVLHTAGNTLMLAAFPLVSTVLPSAVFVFWISGSMASALQQAVMRRLDTRAYFGLDPTAPTARATARVRDLKAQSKGGMAMPVSAATDLQHVQKVVRTLKLSDEHPSESEAEKVQRLLDRELAQGKISQPFKASIVNTKEGKCIDIRPLTRTIGTKRGRRKQKARRV